VQYHILTDRQHEMLRNTYGLTGTDPYRFVIDERTFPLTKDLAEVLNQRAKRSALTRWEDGKNCKVNVDG